MYTDRSIVNHDEFVTELFSVLSQDVYKPKHDINFRIDSCIYQRLHPGMVLTKKQVDNYWHIYDDYYLRMASESFEKSKSGN